MAFSNRVSIRVACRCKRTELTGVNAITLGTGKRRVRGGVQKDCTLRRPVEMKSHNRNKWRTQIEFGGGDVTQNLILSHKYII